MWVSPRGLACDASRGVVAGSRGASSVHPASAMQPSITRMGSADRYMGAMTFRRCYGAGGDELSRAP
jgi:hypothetical protein